MKFPLFAVTEIFSFALFIVKLGLTISNFGSIDKKLLSIVVKLSLLNKTVAENIAFKNSDKISYYSNK